MGGILLLLLFGDDWRAPPPKPKLEIRKVQVDLTPDPPKAKPRKETAAERRKRRAEEKKLEAILKALDSKQQVGLLGVLRAESPGSSVFGSGNLDGGGFGAGSTIGPPQNDREGVHRVVRAHTGAVKYCYEKELITKPDLAGKVTTHFVIDKNGVVTEATITNSTLGDAAVEECLLRQIRSWHFPAKATSVTYPFLFENS